MPTDPAKRKKLYIGVIIACWVGAGLVLYFGYFANSNSAPPPPQTNNVSDSSSGNTGNTGSTGEVPNIATPGGGTVYNAPAVFPNDTKFDFTLLDSQKFQALNPNPNLEIGQVGRDNPFSP